MRAAIHLESTHRERLPPPPQPARPAGRARLRRRPRSGSIRARGVRARNGIVICRLASTPAPKLATESFAANNEMAGANLFRTLFQTRISVPASKRETVVGDFCQFE